MYIVRFQGGLGNQMFQYAFMKALEKSYPDIEVLADLTPYLQTSFHYGFELKKIFNIKLKQATRKDIIRLSNYIPLLSRGRVFRTLNVIEYKLRKMTFGEEKKSTVISHWYGKPASDLFNLMRDDLYFDGFWLGEPFYEKALPSVLDDFAFSLKLYDEFKSLITDFKTLESVAVHVRRGDFVGNPYFPTLTDEYYQKAIQHILEQFPTAHFYLFSDDPDYCESNFPYIQNKSVIHNNTGKNSYKDMFLMSLCKHNIIANSSFSYWSAILNKNPHKLIVSPKWKEGYGFVNKSFVVVTET